MRLSRKLVHRCLSSAASGLLLAANACSSGSRIADAQSRATHLKDHMVLYEMEAMSSSVLHQVV